MPYALLSVYNKTGIDEFAKGLAELGWSLIASGGTARVLKEAGLAIISVQEFVSDAMRTRLLCLLDPAGQPLLTGGQIEAIVANEGKPILDHRVVTLRPEIHGPLLAEYTEQHRRELEELGALYIDLVCVDLYPVQKAIKVGKSRSEVRELTDIGGPAMLRAAAKGERIVICDPLDRLRILQWLKDGEPDRNIIIPELCDKVEFTCAQYSLAIAEYNSQSKYAGLIGRRVHVCKYGENAPQTPAALYTTDTDDPLALDQFTLEAGTNPSYNGFTDLDRILQTTTHVVANFNGERLDSAFAVKHGNVCGGSMAYLMLDPAAVILSRSLLLRRMIDGDKRAIFGGTIMVNFGIDAEYAEIILSYGVDQGRRILDNIVAPSFTPEAIETLRRREDKCRFLANPALQGLNPDSLDQARRFRYVRGGFLLQPNYVNVPDWDSLNLHPHDADDVKFGKGICDTTNSNTMTLVNEGRVIGNGAGQQDRIGGIELAIKRARDAGHSTDRSVLVGDSFAAFADAVERAIEAGVRAIYLTVGPLTTRNAKEEHHEILRLCDMHGVRLYLSPDSKDRGFFGH